MPTASRSRSLEEIRQVVAECSPKKVAEDSGFGLSMVSLVLRGQRRPSIDGAKKLADALTLSLDEFWDYLQSVNSK